MKRSIIGKERDKTDREKKALRIISGTIIIIAAVMLYHNVTFADGLSQLEQYKAAQSALLCIVAFRLRMQAV